MSLKDGIKMSKSDPSELKRSKFKMTVVMKFITKLKKQKQTPSHCLIMKNLSSTTRS